jgi:two-component system OmpR family sensor kinase
MASDAPLLRRLLSNPARWPVRWRLAGVSAGLTLVILVVFAGIVGRLATDRIRDDFHSELQNTARSLANSIHPPVCDQLTGQCTAHVPPSMAPADSYIRVVEPNGEVIGERPGAPDVGAPTTGTTEVGAYEVASERIATTGFGVGSFVQYIRPHESVDETVNRLWLFLGLGVIVGTLLSTLAGLAVAGRAMRPIAALTAIAREIATTRDPSRRIPAQPSDDEVAELARTFDDMLVELDSARSETQQMVQRQREFVADASHELRTPLTSILANLELLQEGLAGEPEHVEDTEMVESALRSSRRMRRLVADLLLLARADAGRLGAHGPCELTEIVAAAVDEVAPLAREQTLQMHAPAPVAVDGNADELHRVAVNLIDNAVRHTPKGTRIDVTVEKREGEAVLEVLDDGPGLPDGVGEALFARFVRGSGPADLSSETGSGLGLAIVSAVVASHQGEVEAGLSPHGGARFTVRIPLQKSTPKVPGSDLRKVSRPV